jgi:hypothetical protein
MKNIIFIKYTGPVLIARNRTTYRPSNGQSLEQITNVTKAIKILEETNYGYF